MDKERVGIGLDRLNLISRCAIDTKFTISDPNSAFYIFIFQNLPYRRIQQTNLDNFALIILLSNRN